MAYQPQIYRESSNPYIGALFGEPDTAVRDKQIYEEWLGNGCAGAEPKLLARKHNLHALTIYAILRRVQFEMWGRGNCSTEYAIKHNCWLPEWGDKPVIGPYVRVTKKLIAEYHSKYQHDTWLDSRMPRRTGR